jgi:hypothetical protein
MNKTQYDKLIEWNNELLQNYIVNDIFLVVYIVLGILGNAFVGNQNNLHKIRPRKLTGFKFMANSSDDRNTQAIRSNTAKYGMKYRSSLFLFIRKL